MGCPCSAERRISESEFVSRRVSCAHSLFSSMRIRSCFAKLYFWRFLAEVCGAEPQEQRYRIKPGREEAGFQSCITVRYNVRHRKAGYLFQGRYKAVMVDPEAGGYFEAVADYIHSILRGRVCSGKRRLSEGPLEQSAMVSGVGAPATWMAEGVASAGGTGL